jgi:mRNA interferase MazF
MPRRGEVWVVDLGLAQTVRPALVLNIPYHDADRALITIVSHSTMLRGFEFEVAVDVPFLKKGAFVTQSLITIPSKLALRKLGSLTPAQLALVEQGVRRWLGL